MLYKILIDYLYFLREIQSFDYLLLGLAAFVMLFGFFDLIAEVQDIGKGNYQLPQALGYVTLTLPGRIYELAPIAALIGALYAVTNLARHSEITVLRASGLSTWGLMCTLLKVGLLFAVLTFLVGEFVAPRAEPQEHVPQVVALPQALQQFVGHLQYPFARNAGA